MAQKTTPFSLTQRKTWGARPAAAAMTPQSPPTEAFVHYSDTAGAARIDTWPEVYAAARSIQTFHIDGRGWSDIGYHYLVVQPGGTPVEGGARGAAQAASSRRPISQRGVTATRVDANNAASAAVSAAVGPGGAVLVGRAARMVPAAQLGHNTGTLAICVVAGPLDTISRRTLYLIERCVQLHPSVRSLGGHRDVVATSCPGDALYSQIPRMAKALGIRTYK